MLRAEPLLRIHLLMLASEAQDAALELARFGVFNPAPCALDALAESPAAAYREAWLEAEARLSKLLEQCGDSGPLQYAGGCRSAGAGRPAGTEQLAEGGLDAPVWPATKAKRRSRRSASSRRAGRNAGANWSA